MLLRDALWPTAKEWTPLIVSCYNRGMTMWATSPNAHVVGDLILCTGCRPPTEGGDAA